MQNGVLRSDSSPFSGVMGTEFWCLICVRGLHPDHELRPVQVTLENQIWAFSGATSVLTLVPDNLPQEGSPFTAHLRLFSLKVIWDVGFSFHSCLTKLNSKTRLYWDVNNHNSYF